MVALSSAGRPNRDLALEHPRGHFVDGDWLPPSSGDWIEVEDPSTGRTFSSIAAGTAPDVDTAVEVARRTYRAGAWSRAVPAERGRTLWRLAEAVRSNADQLSRLESRDSGKPVIESREDVAGTADVFEYYAGMASKIVGQTLPLPGSQLGTLFRVPIGVVGAITPWNFPLFVTAWKVAPALSGGNSVVLKPPQLASLTSLALGQLALEAGVPAGVLNVVTGPGTIAGAHLAGHRDVDVLAFTGGTETGRSVMRARAEVVRPVQLELGGKSPNVVFADADIDRAVDGAAFGIFYTQGENCNAGSRVIVEAGIYDEFLAKLSAKAQAIRVLPALDEASQLGALISREQLDRVASYVDIGVQEGARILAGGFRLEGEIYGGGHFYAPTVLADVRRDYRVFQEEIFGPVVTVTPFESDDEAIELANATEFGLAAGVWTASLDRAIRFTQEVDSGYVWVNTYNGTPIEAPFGGVKSSGFGRDCGTQAIDTYTTWKSVVWATAPFGDWYNRDD
jgi:acyl-CoA reductase-like NAD-dependent aldehyde dehydrogenase